MISNIVKNIVSDIVSPIRIPVYRFTVKTTVPGETFALPLELTGTYDFDINHGDGSSHHITAWDHADVTHTYATPGTHEIAITGTITGWRFNNGGDCAKYYETKSVGPLRVGNSGGYWYGCVNHTWTATDILDLTGTTNMAQAFQANTLLTMIASINSWDWSNVTNMYAGWYGCDLFDQALSMDTSSVTQINLALFNALAFDQDLSGLNISSLTNATSFLQGATLSVANYDALILSWGPQAQTIVANFHGGSSKYTTGGAVKTARDAWVAKGWTITDGGENLGSELIADVANRDFSLGQRDWITISGDDVTYDNVSQNWNCNEANAQRLIITLAEGTLYRFEHEVIEYTSGNIALSLGGIAYGLSESVGVQVSYRIAGAGDRIDLYAPTNDFIGKLDNVSLKECL